MTPPPPTPPMIGLSAKYVISGFQKFVGLQMVQCFHVIVIAMFVCQGKISKTAIQTRFIELHIRKFCGHFPTFTRKKSVILIIISGSPPPNHNDQSNRQSLYCLLKSVSFT